MKRFMLAYALVALPLTAHAADLSTSYSPPPSGDYYSPESATGWQVWGDAALQLEYYDNDYGHDTAIEASGEAIFISPFGLNFKIGAYGGNVFEASGWDEYSYGGVYTDIYYANSTYAVGVFGEYDFDDDSFYSYEGGLQAARFYDMFDVGAEVGWWNDKYDDNGYWVGAWLQAYLTPNTSLEGFVEYENGDGYSGYSLGGEVEHRFAGSNFSVFGGGWYYDEIDDDYSSYQVTGGIRVFFDPDGTTLQQYNRVNPF